MLVFLYSNKWMIFDKYGQTDEEVASRGAVTRSGRSRRKESEPCKCKELIKAKDEEIKKLQFEIAELQKAIEDRRDYIFVDKLSINAEAEYVFV